MSIDIDQIIKTALEEGNQIGRVEIRMLHRKGGHTMNDAEILKNLCEEVDALELLDRQLVKTKAERDGHAEKIAHLNKRLWESMQEQDVTASGNTGHKQRKTQWLIQLCRDMEESSHTHG